MALMEKLSSSNFSSTLVEFYQTELEDFTMEDSVENLGQNATHAFGQSFYKTLKPDF